MNVPVVLLALNDIGIQSSECQPKHCLQGSGRYPPRLGRRSGSPLDMLQDFADMALEVKLV